jgi:hypothetical protein
MSEQTNKEVKYQIHPTLEYKTNHPNVEKIWRTGAVSASGPGQKVVERLHVLFKDGSREDFTEGTLLEQLHVAQIFLNEYDSGFMDATHASFKEFITKQQNRMSEQQKLTQGQLLVGLEFNPSGDPKVIEAKQAFANLADMIFGDQRPTEEPYLTNTIKGDAIRQILHAQMAVVKYLTWNK